MAGWRRTGPGRLSIWTAMILLVILAAAPASGADKGTLVEKNGEYLFVEASDPSLRLLMDRALKNGWITQDEYLQTLKESEERAALVQPNYKLWYDRGFNFSMNDNAFFLKMRFRMQTRFTESMRNSAWNNVGDGKNFPELVGVFGDYRINRSGTDEASTMSVRRLRFYWMGHVYNPDFKYFIQVGADTSDSPTTQGTVQLQDAYFTQTTFPLANLQFGQFKVYWNRSQVNSTASMQFADRALVQDAFTANGLDRRDIGITIMNDEELYPFNYYFGVFNGAGPNFTRQGLFKSDQPTPGCPGGQAGGFPIPQPPIACPPAQRNLNSNTRFDVNELMYSARVMLNVLGRPGYGEGDITYSETPQIAIGGGYAYNPGINTSTNNAFIGVDLSDLTTRSRLAALGNGRQLGWGIVDYSSWAVDTIFKYRGFSLQAEYYFKTITRHDKGVPCLQFNLDNNGCTAYAPGLLGNSTGWYVQGGYYLIPRTLELAARYAYWDPDTHAAGDLIKQFDISLNWFLSKTYDHQIVFTFSNIAMGTGGYAIGRSAPLPLQFQSTPFGTPIDPRDPCPTLAGQPFPVEATCPNGTVPVDAKGGTLIENLIRIQYQIFF